MKTSWRCLSSLSSEDVFKTSTSRLNQDKYIRLTHTSSEDVFIKTNIHTSSRHIQDVFKASSRRLGNIFKTSCKIVFKTSSRYLQGVLQRYLQDVFKTYYHVKLFLVTQFQHVFETYSKRFWDVLLRLLSTGGLPRLHFGKTYGQCTKFPRVIKVSQVLVFHFTTLFSGCLQRRIENLVEHLHWSFFSKIPNVVKLLTIFARKPPSQMFDWVENRLLAKGFKYHRKN